LLGLASVGTVAALGWVLLRRVLRPVAELRDSVVHFGRGEGDTRLPIRRRDELGDLALAFADMQSQLRAHQTDLEQRVEERSREVLRTARLAQLGTLAAGIAHEINNPLASIVACSEGLLRDLRDGTTDNDGLRDYLGILHKEALRARDITGKLLRFAHHDRTRREPVALVEQVHEVSALFSHQFADAGVSLEIDAPESPDDPDGLSILGDAAEWRQVLFNLLRNALDASPRGGRIVVSVRHDHGDVELGVRDQGPGIPAEIEERVFEPFFTTKPPGRGTGLGLSIVHRIVTTHGGRIRLAGDDTGAHVIVTVPALRRPFAGDRG
jgi:signal transduction histidine kinase